MESGTLRLRIQTYKEQLAMCEQVRDTLSKELNNMALTADERVAVGRRLDKVVEEGRALRVMPDSMERKERESTDHSQL
jgi:Trp operon repressor